MRNLGPGRAALLFPLALVLYEFSVYIANDMIQPGMVLVIREYGVGSEWISRSMTAFLLGGVLLTWLLGPLSDRIGRRPVMLGGVILFLLSCLAILLAWNIESFMVLRLVQGMGLCFIAAVGYATVQEAFEEKTAVKLMALMANVALIAPLLGPVLGAVLTAFWPWRLTFVLIALMAGLGLLGLWRKMPETVTAPAGTLSLGQIGRDYRILLQNRPFLRAAVCVCLLGLPVIIWIGLSPVLIIERAGLHAWHYGLAQFPVIGGLILGNILLIRVTDRWPLGRSVQYARWSLCAGLVVLAAAFWLPAQLPWVLMTGIGLIGFSEGLSFAVLYRFTLTATQQSIGIASSGLGMIIMAFFAVALELASWLYETVGGWTLPALLLAAGGLYLLLVPAVLQHGMAARAVSPDPA